MELFLSKLLPLTLFPLGASLVAGLGVLALLLLGHRRSAATVLTIVLLGLWAASTPAFANWLLLSLERQYLSDQAGASAPADVAVVLGGVLSAPRPPGDMIDLGGAIDRVFEGARLYREGRVGNLLVSGGNLPWQDEGKSEAVLVADVLVDLGVPRDRIIIEPDSRNTRENALNSARIVLERGFRRVLLVTSAAHMPRALAAFRAAGVDAIPVPVDFRSAAYVHPTVLDYLPDAGALATTTDAFKEYIGALVYGFRGWM